MQIIKKPMLSVVIPTLNEQSNLSSLIVRLDTTLKRAHIAYELIFVDDHSTDKTVFYLNDLARLYPINVVIKQGKPGKAFSIARRSSTRERVRYRFYRC